MKRILTILNVDDAPPGLIGERIRSHSGECIEINPHKGGTLPKSPGGYDGLIILGGPMSVADPAFANVFEPMAALVRAFHADRTPVMGLCLGSQLIAKAFGQTVQPHRQLQFGFKKLEITDEGKSDPLLEGLDTPQTAFVHHLDTYDLPDGAVLLMSERDTLCHTFRVGQSTYALQSHPEATANIIRGWMKRTEAGVRQKLGRRGEELIESLEDDFISELPKASRFAESIADRWFSLVERRAAEVI
ncbi:MAG: type 1 glutamine amidotransferase [Aestuariivirga sp.]|nr:type 1 glutamine amidotransferase [Aestuariivirga sp.]